jgi:hypothetical protein
MHQRDHAPPHFHAAYAEHEAVISIRDLRVTSGYLPGRLVEFVLDWATQHQQELVDNWDLCSVRKIPNQIAPLK